MQFKDLSIVLRDVYESRLNSCFIKKLHSNPPDSEIDEEAAYDCSDGSMEGRL